MEDIMNLHDDWNVFEEVLTAASLPVEQGGIGIRLAFIGKAMSAGLEEVLMPDTRNGRKSVTFMICTICCRMRSAGHI